MCGSAAKTSCAASSYSSSSSSSSSSSRRRRRVREKEIGVNGGCHCQEGRDGGTSRANERRCSFYICYAPRPPSSYKRGMAHIPSRRQCGAPPLPSSTETSFHVDCVIFALTDRQGLHVHSEFFYSVVRVPLFHSFCRYSRFERGRHAARPGMSATGIRCSLACPMSWDDD